MKIDKESHSFFTERQLEVLTLRSHGLVQREIARRLSTTRANISILEKRAYEKVKRAKATLDLFNNLNVAVQVSIPPKTRVRDIPRLVFKQANAANIKMKLNNPRILEEVIFRASDKMVVTNPLLITILPDGTLDID